MSKKKLALLVSSIVFCIINARAQQTLPYLDSTLPIEARITDLLLRLTLEEKIIQLSDSWGSKGIPRLKVPTMLKTEGLHGQSYSTGATIFPQAIAMASTFDTALVHTIGRTTAIESKAAGLRVSWSPVLDVARDVRWGRVEETYGEDPYLVSRMGVAWINGFQNEGMIAVPKHFAGHGEPLGGRDSHDVGLSDRTMRNVHLVPFRAAIKEAHAGGVMAAYSTWDAVPDNGSGELLQKILREEWGFDGIVVSDCSAPENFLRKQSVVYDLDEAAKMAILAGVDIECGSVNAHTLAGAIQRGVLRESDLDVNLRRVFRAKYRLGLFDRPGPDKMTWEKLSVYDIPPHRALAREAAIEGSVLLKNDQNILPLSKDIKTIAVIGPDAGIAQTGDYSAKAAPGQLVTLLQGIKSHVSAGTTILYEKGCNVESMDSSGFDRAVDAAAKADAVVLVVGDYSNNDPAIENKEKTTTGENVDGATLEIPGVQRRLIRRIAATGKPVVLVLVNGKPFTLTWEAEHLAGILETWYPGEEGGNATADILFGDANPSGRLPVTFPRHVGQLPLRYDYLPSGRNYNYYDMPFTPLYRFGYGLSYTTFNYSNLTTAVNGDGTVSVSADIENTGNRPGDEVAQLYLTDVVSSVITPVISLKGFQRVHLDNGEKKTIRFRLSPYQLSLLDASMERVVEPGKFRVHVGGVSPEPPSGNTDHKGKIGYKDPKEGVSGEFEISTGCKASFIPSMQAPSDVKGGVTFPVTVTVTNEGNITDVADIKIYGEALLDDYRSEIDPGQSVKHTFNITLYKSGQQNITAIVGKKLLTWPLSLAQGPAPLTPEKATPMAGGTGQKPPAPGGKESALQNLLFYRDTAFYSAEKKTFIPAGDLDIYRKSFTLASWVKIDGYDHGEAMFFGGQAPMGADVDSTGTVLSAGVQNGVMLLSFLGSDIKGNAKIPTGKWVHLAYTYDAENSKGSLYINGRLDKSASQKAYAGQLGIIGGAPRFGHGKFTMDKVLVAGDCLSPENIKELYQKGISGLRNGGRTEYAGVFAPSRMLVHEDEKPWRDNICLNGLWDFEPKALSTGFKEGVDPAPALDPVDPAGWDKTPIRIPSPWNVNSFADRNGQGGDFRCYPSYPAAWESCKMAWLQKKFFVPRDWKDRRIQIHFEAVAGDVQVLVNGRPVGTHFGISLPFDMDITDATRPGGDNELCVGVRKASLFDHRGNYGRRTYQAGSFWGQYIAGIWQDVYVLAVPDVHISTVFIQPMVDKDTLQAELSLVNDRNTEATVAVDADAADLRLPARQVKIPPHGETKVVLSAAVNRKLKYWSPDAPNLYNLIATVHEKGRVVDAKSTRFGWRQVSLQGNQVLLNGKPIVMRGDSWHFLGIPQMSRRYAEAWYRAMRDAGLNAVRLHAQPYPSFYLDVADSMGILVLDESAMWASDGGPKLDDPLYWQDSKQHLTGLILRDRNHPSVFGWSVSNEIMPVVKNVFHNPPGMADTLLKYDEEWATICRRLDPTRTWISADGEEDGQGRFPVYLVHYGGMDAMNRAQKSGKPWGVGEAGNAYYGTPEQVAQTNGMRAYESFEGRMEGVAASSYRSLVAQQQRNAIYQSVFNMVWYGLRPLPLGMQDTTRPPRLEDGVWFTHFKEGEPGVQPERLGPYCTTLNPGYDPALPVYRTWPLFDAIRDAATGANAGRWMADATQQPVTRTPLQPTTRVPQPGQSSYGTRSARVMFIDAAHVPQRGAIDSVTARGGTVVLWSIRPEMLDQLNKALPARLELYPRKASSLLPVGQDSITAGITAADLYFSEMRPPEIVDYTLGGPLVDGSQVLLQACGTDWEKWNKQPEYAKTAMILRSELEAKPSGAVLIARPMGAGRLVLSTLPVSPHVDKAAKAVQLLLGNLGITLGDTVARKPLQQDGNLSLNGAGEFWVLSPRSLDDLLSEPNIPIVNLEVESGDEVWLNDTPILRGKGIARSLRLHQGWNHFTVKGSVKGRFTCNQPDFLKQLDSAFDRP